MFEPRPLILRAEPKPRAQPKFLSWPCGAAEPAPHIERQSRSPTNLSFEEKLSLQCTRSR
jgi:hypothetical protein